MFLNPLKREGAKIIKGIHSIHFISYYYGHTFNSYAIINRIFKYKSYLFFTLINLLLVYIYSL